MACKYCLNEELPEDFRYCPRCGEYLEVARGLQWLKNMFAESYEQMVNKLHSDRVKDENGEYIEFERGEPIEVRHLGFDESMLAPDNHDIDISKEMEWLEKKNDELRRRSCGDDA